MHHAAATLRLIPMSPAPSMTLRGSTNCPSTYVPLPTRSLGDKLQLLAMQRPHALRVLENVVDGLLANYAAARDWTT